MNFLNIEFNFRNYLFLFILCIGVKLIICEPPRPPVMKPGIIDETVEDVVNSLEEIVYYYNINETMNLNAGQTSIRIEVEVDQNFDTECPVLFSVRENHGLLSWELPQVYTNGHGEVTQYYTAGRTLCVPRSAQSTSQTIFVAISTCRELYGAFKLSLWVRDDTVVGLSQFRSIVSSPTAPHFYRFDFPDEHNKADFLFLEVDSDQSTCAMVSIQAPSCPVLDQENNVQYQGYWQSMSHKAGVTIRTWQYPRGFTLVMVVLKDDERCNEHSSIENRGGNDAKSLERAPPRTKNLTFAIHEAIGKSGYVLPTLVPLIFIFGLVFVTCLISIGFQHLKHDLVLEHIDDLGTPINAAAGTLGLSRSRFQSELTIASLEKDANVERILAQSKRYYWSLLIVAIFYCVPVFQLIINYLKVVYRTGEQDICYYNFYCARPLGYVMDFNHIYSNTGYILLGLAFIALVKLRHSGFHVGSEEEYFKKSNGRFRKIFPLLNSNMEYGVLQHFGLFYALGLALVLEGLLSGAYHICPNQSNFQFDTSFMYAIAFLGIVKIYQYRHPVYISADITFISLAFVASSAVLGLLFNNLIFKISFSVVHFGTMVALLLYLFYFGFITDEYGEVVTSMVGVYKGMYIQFWTDSGFSIPHWSRLILPFLAVFFNVVIIIMIWTVMDESNFATQILAIFVVNLFVYMAYYIIMKWIHSEYQMKLWIQPLIYLILSGGLWIISLYFFQNASSSWDMSPAESKTQNVECVVYDFYDNHDLWHFLSAGALFCSFMLLLTIDDDLVTRKHDKIAVF